TPPDRHADAIDGAHQRATAWDAPCPPDRLADVASSERRRLLFSSYSFAQLAGHLLHYSKQTKDRGLLPTVRAASRKTRSRPSGKWAGCADDRRARRGRCDSE